MNLARSSNFSHVHGVCQSGKRKLWLNRGVLIGRGILFPMPPPLILARTSNSAHVHGFCQSGKRRRWIGDVIQGGYVLEVYGKDSGLAPRHFSSSGTEM